MGVALKLTPAKRVGMSRTERMARHAQVTPIKKAPKYSLDGWEMTASEALRVNYLDERTDNDRIILDYLDEY